MEAESSSKKEKQKIEDLKNANQVFTKICSKKPIIISKKVILEALVQPPYAFYILKEKYKSLRPAVKNSLLTDTSSE